MAEPPLVDDYADTKADMLLDTLQEIQKWWRPESCGKEKWRILPVGCLTTNRPSGKTAAGGMRHGEA
jgi:hypothetical protein